MLPCICICTNFPALVAFAWICTGSTYFLVVSISDYMLAICCAKLSLMWCKSLMPYVGLKVSISMLCIGVSDVWVNFKDSVAKCNRRLAHSILNNLSPVWCLGIWNMNGKEVNALASGEGRKFMLVFKGNSKASLSLSCKEQCKTAQHLLICLLMAVAQIKSCWFVQALVANQNARGGHELQGRMLVQSRPSWPVHASCTTSQWIINLSASISALESIPNTKAKCPPCSEAALLRVCGYFNKN